MRCLGLRGRSGGGTVRGWMNGIESVEVERVAAGHAHKSALLLDGVQEAFGIGVQHFPSAGKRGVLHRRQNLRAENRVLPLLKRLRQTGQKRGGEQLYLVGTS